MRPEICKFLYDVKTACETLMSFISDDKSLTEYEKDALLRSAVERQLMIIGEALSQATRIDKSLENKISHVRQIISFRNILVHGYSVIENATVWGIMQNDLQSLYEEVTILLEQNDTAG